MERRILPISGERTFAGWLDAVIRNNRVVVKTIGADCHKRGLGHHTNLNWLSGADEGNAYTEEECQ